MTKDGIYKHHDIRNILIVLGSAVLCAGLVAALFIYYYGPSGRYVAGQTLIDPSLLTKMNDQTPSSKKIKQMRDVFDDLEFSFRDPLTHQIQKKLISLNAYQQFYHLIRAEKSIPNVTPNIQDLFMKSPLTVLSLGMHTVEKAGKTMTKNFQIVEFVQEDYFRVQLHDTKEQNGWAYFYRSHLFEEILQLFTVSLNR